MGQLKFNELNEQQQKQARAMFLDAGTIRDDCWYELDLKGGIFCRNPNPYDASDPADYGDEYEDFGVLKSAR